MRAKGASPVVRRRNAFRRGGRAGGESHRLLRALQGGLSSRPTPRGIRPGIRRGFRLLARRALEPCDLVEAGPLTYPRGGPRDRINPARGGSRGSRATDLVARYDLGVLRQGPFDEAGLGLSPR